jgi:hypothetical protein
MQQSTSTGIPKIIFDPAEHELNVHEVGKLLNYYVQRQFTGLHDCISTRTLRPIIAPTEPGIAPTQVPPQASSSSASSSSGTSMTLRSSATSNSTAPERSASPTSPPSSPRGAVSDMETFRYLEKYKLYLLAQEKRDIELSQLFGIIDELLSVTSKERVVAHAQYPACLAGRNGSALWNIVYATHQSVNMYHTPAQQVEAANRNYFNLHQTASMSLDDYYEKFNNTVKGLTEATITKPSDQALAVRFLSGLNRILFQELHHQLNNLPHFNIAYPADLPDAYRLAVNYIPTSSRVMAAQERNVFSTSKRAKKKKKKSKRPPTPSDSSESSSSSSESEVEVCRYCKKPNHSIEDCYKLKKKKEMEKKATIGLTEVNYAPASFDYDVNFAEFSLYSHPSSFRPPSLAYDGNITDVAQLVAANDSQPSSTSESSSSALPTTTEGPSLLPWDHNLNCPKL